MKILELQGFFNLTESSIRRRISWALEIEAR